MMSEATQKLPDSTAIDAGANNLKSNPYKASTGPNGAASNPYKSAPVTKRIPKSSSPIGTNTPPTKRSRTNSSLTPSVAPITKSGLIRGKSTALPIKMEIIEGPIMSPSRPEKEVSTMAHSPDTPPYSISSAASSPTSGDKSPPHEDYSKKFSSRALKYNQSPSTGVRKGFLNEFLDPKSPEYEEEGRLVTSPKVHRDWQAQVGHTAKCDGCGKHNKSVIQRCGDCSKHMCRLCISGKTGPNIMNGHEADLGKLVWDAATVKALAAEAKGLAVKEPAKKASKPKGRPKGKRTSKSNDEDEDSGDYEPPRPKKLKADQRRVLGRSSGDTTIVVSDNDSYEDGRMTVKHQDLNRTYDGYQRRKEWDREVEQHLDERSNRLPDSFQHPGHHQGFYRASNAAGPAVQPLGWPAPRRALTYMGADPGVDTAPLGYAPPRGMIGYRYQQQAHNFGETVTGVFKAHNHEIEQQQEVILQKDIEKARATNTEYLAYVQAGKIREADELMEAAATLIRMGRGV